MLSHASVESSNCGVFSKHAVTGQPGAEISSALVVMNTGDPVIALARSPKKIQELARRLCPQLTGTKDSGCTCNFHGALLTQAPLDICVDNLENSLQFVRLRKIVHPTGS